MKFKRGDIVWCKRHNACLITNYHVACKVTAVLGDKLVVKIIDGPCAGREYDVGARHFELAHRKVVIV